MSQAKHLVVNFGRNVQFRPQQFDAPRSEQQLLDMIAGANGCVRAVGVRSIYSNERLDRQIIDS